MNSQKIDELRALAENAQRHHASVVSVRPELLAELLDERLHLRAAIVRLEYDVTEALAEAMGMEKDPDYGYPIGDHTAETMARGMVAYCASLREPL